MPHSTPIQDQPCAQSANHGAGATLRVHGPITIITDVHNNIGNVDKLKNSPNLFCLGDIVDMFDRELNLNTLGYWHTLKIPTIRGNHDRTVSQSLRLPPQEQAYLAGLPFSFKIESDYGNLLMYHSTAVADDKVVPRNLPEEKAARFFKQTPDVKYVFFGHTHQVQKTVYPSGLTLVNVGTLQLGHYAILDEKGVSFRKLK